MYIIVIACIDILWGIGVDRKRGFVRTCSREVFLPHY